MNRKSKNKSEVKLKRVIEFEDVFQNEERKPFAQYLAGSNRKFILNVASYFLGFKNRDSKYNDVREFLGTFFRKENSEFANEAYEKIKIIESKEKGAIIINPYSSLKLFEYYFSREEEEETLIEGALEIALFKAYLALNSEFVNKQKVVVPSLVNCDEELKVSMMMFCIQFPISDKLNYDIVKVYTSQIIKSIYFFEFLESNKQGVPLLKSFLSYFECTTWQKYLKRLLPLINPLLYSENEAHTDVSIKKSEMFDRDCEFLEKLSVQDIDPHDQHDFLTLRSRPFYKVKTGVYRVIFNLFLVDKIFKGMYFLMRDINAKLPADKKVKDIRSFYGSEFSEKTLCYKSMESIYNGKCTRYSGKELDEKGIVGAPDYYLRKGKNILIIESKDFLLAAEKKMSFDYRVYEEEFGRILDYEEMGNGKLKPKAVVQLANSVRMILTGNFPVDKDYHYKDVFIYPILLTHDDQFEVPGFNKLINFWFQDELIKLKEEGLYVQKVKPLTVLCIDSIILNQAALSERVDLHLIIDGYHHNQATTFKGAAKKNISQEEYEEYKQNALNKLVPFSSFIEEWLEKRNMRESPPLLEVVGPALFKEEYYNAVDKS